MPAGSRAEDKLRRLKDQWQEQPPPQQPPPPPEKPPDELEEPEPAVANTESWIVAFLPEHLGQVISCCLLITIFSKRSLQLSQMYS
jgi:hypothetical protein